MPAAGAISWPLVDGWLRVEYKNPAGNWIGVTRTWLAARIRARHRDSDCPGEHRASKCHSGFSETRG